MNVKTAKRCSRKTQAMTSAVMTAERTASALVGLISPIPLASSDGKETCIEKDRAIIAVIVPTKIVIQTPSKIL